MMLIAKIGHETFKLETIADAEAVLKIFSKAPRLEWHYDGKCALITGEWVRVNPNPRLEWHYDGKCAYYTEKQQPHIEVAITQDAVLSAEEHAAIQAAREQVAGA